MSADTPIKYCGLTGNRTKLRPATPQGRLNLFMTTNETTSGLNITRKQMIDLLNEDLAGAYQAIIAYIVYSQVLKGAAYTDIARELETHAGEELAHAIKIAKQIDYLGGMPNGPRLTPQHIVRPDFLWPMRWS